MIPSHNFIDGLLDVPQEVDLPSMPQDVLQLLLLEFGLDLAPGRLDGIVQQTAHRWGVHLLNHSVQETVSVVV